MTDQPTPVDRDVLDRLRRGEELHELDDLERDGLAPDERADHRLLTVRQPWAKPIVDGLKTVENRAHGFGLSYRGPLWIHAGAAWSAHGLLSELVLEHYPETNTLRGGFREAGFVLGAILGAVDVVDVHHAEPGCCASPWAEQSYPGEGSPTHLVFENARKCRGPVVSGNLGLWRADRLPGLPQTLDLLLEELVPC